MNQFAQPTALQKTLAWSVHAFTATGLIAGYMAILAINEGDWRTAMLWLLACLVIDGIDGTFARLFHVKEVLPNIDGKTIDYVIDFATYAIIPAYFFHQAQLVPAEWQLPCVSIILLVSALYYGKEGMVSSDMYFIGFPVMWNMVVFYLVFVFQFTAFWNIIAILFFAILHFVPIKFVYPSRTANFRWLTIGVTFMFLLSTVLILYYYPERKLWLISIPIIAMVYYGLMASNNTWFED